LSAIGRPWQFGVVTALLPWLVEKWFCFEVMSHIVNPLTPNDL
jgi:hypothetical protein